MSSEAIPACVEVRVINQMTFLLTVFLLWGGHSSWLWQERRSCLRYSKYDKLSCWLSACFGSIFGFGSGAKGPYSLQEDGEDKEMRVWRLSLRPYQAGWPGADQALLLPAKEPLHILRFTRKRNQESRISRARTWTLALPSILVA